MLIDIKILFDNYSGESDFQTGFGYSCFIKKGYGGILFDTGGDPNILLKNIEKAGIKPSMITKVVLSHSHKDHTGGLEGLLKLKKELTIYAGKSFSEAFLKNTLPQTVTHHFIDSNPVEIMNGVYLTGELGEDIKEISLIMNTGGGLVVVTGCAHPGVDTILKKSKEILGETIFALVGGLHLKNKKKEEIESVTRMLQDAGVKYIAPSHCTGDYARDMLKKAFKSGFIEAGAGTHIYIGGSCDYV